MRLHRFYINTPIAENKIVVKDEHILHQWRNVFRYNVGSEVVLFDGSGFEYDCVIERLSNREAELNVVSKKKGIMPENKITLYQSLIKKDKMEWVVEKATELGVSKIVPVVSDRSEKKGFNLERARKIAVEASEQCGRGDVPLIDNSQKIIDISLNDQEKFIVFDSSGVPFDSSLLSTNYRLLSILVGPEGGWSDKEIERFKEAKMEIFNLGKLTLRAETAAVVALTKLS